MKTTGQMFCDILEEAGIDHVFGLPGGATPLLLDALADRKDTIQPVLARHEGGAACMADMYARLTGKPGVLVGQGIWIATSGGYGIVESFLSGVPLVIVTDITDYGSLPQFGPYQDGSGDYGSVDLPAMMRAMTKFTTFVSNPSEFVHGLRLAIKHATTGRPGPACVIMKFDVSYAAFDPETINPKLYPLAGMLSTSPPCISADDAQKAARMLAGAKNPVIIAGRGVHDGRAYDELRTLAEFAGIPVATSYMGKSSIPETHSLAVGTIGAIGQKIANDLVTGADVILAVGTCLAPDNTKMMSADFIRPDKQKIIQVDIDSRNAGWTYPVAMGITSDAGLALAGIVEAMKEMKLKGDPKKKAEEIAAKKKEYRTFDEEPMYSDETPIAPERVVKELNAVMKEDDLLVLDGGNNRMWFAHHFMSKKEGQVIAPGGAAGVGYAPPASVAAQLLQPKRRVVCVSGDGGLMMQLYTLEMVRQYQVPLTMLVLNNSCLGNVMDFQAPDRRVMTEYPTPGFAAIASTFDIDSTRVEKPEDIHPALEKAMSSKKASLVEVLVQDCAHFKLSS